MDLFVRIRLIEAIRSTLNYDHELSTVFFHLVRLEAIMDTCSIYQSVDEYRVGAGLPQTTLGPLPKIFC